MRIGKSIIATSIVTSMVMMSTVAVAADGQVAASKLSLANAPAVKAVRVGGLKNNNKSNFFGTPVVAIMSLLAVGGGVAVAASAKANKGAPASP